MILYDKNSKKLDEAYYIEDHLINSSSELSTLKNISFSFL